MPKRASKLKWFRVRNTYRCTADVIVQAEDPKSALILALGMADERNHDDSLYDSEVIVESSEEIEL